MQLSKDEFEAYLNATTTTLQGERPLSPRPNDHQTPWRTTTSYSGERLGQYGTWLRRERERDFVLLYASFRSYTRKGIN